MKGQILDYSIQDNAGIITTAEGPRYVFLGTEWKAKTVLPTRGMWVDFDVQGEYAVAVFQALEKTEKTKQVKQKGKSKATITLLALFLGGLGAHKFYVGSWGWGIVYFLLTSIGIGAAIDLFFVCLIIGIITFIEFIHYVVMSDEEFYGRLYEFHEKNPGPFGFFW